MSFTPKKPKVEMDSLEKVTVEENGEDRCIVDDEEEALVALIEHRTKEVEHLKQRITYYRSQLTEAEKRLDNSQSKLARLRSVDNLVSKDLLDNGAKKAKQERRSASPIHIDKGHSRTKAQSRPQLVNPAVNPKIVPASVGLESQVTSSFPSQSNKVEKPSTKRKLEQKQHKELIPLICRLPSPCIIRCHPGSHFCSQHKRKLRSLALNPINDQLFVTSALDGFVNLWQIQAKGSSASLLSSTDCVSPKQRRWPEGIAWHPLGNSLFSAYSADGGDSQISVLNLNTSQERKRVKFLEEKPHLKGIINSIVFMPWVDVCFTTGGSDHAVILWSEKDDGEQLWKPKVLHRSLHSSAVMGVAGMQQKQIVLSTGADKRIIGYDLLNGRVDFKHQIESKCMDVLPNPTDFNLYMVQTGAPEKQLRLFDIRLRQTEIHAFGWKQENSESQSALINQAWSPDGLYITSGSADPMIHVFDIRYNSHRPSQSVKAHQKRVFKAVWHHSLPLLISISSDLHIGLHKIV
ncbi:U5 small nuclear ribonucleoprotein 40 kDa protein-like [Telopea speciosissima]|uniref:U5 small nuclear ribonucleoprotein 40 kDa protein-like n=1 Tax=Telopea speciosissima TaxID=54955 RepID=UPI001CC6E96C|nr:U5 small nuclear ribonucleoprotein 40 kDa protein-like [Telopea speciosissima]